MKKRLLTCSENKRASIAAAIEPRAMSDGWRRVRKMIKGAFPEEKETLLGYCRHNGKLILNKLFPECRVNIKNG